MTKVRPKGKTSQDFSSPGFSIKATWALIDRLKYFRVWSRTCSDIRDYPKTLPCTIQRAAQNHDSSLYYTSVSQIAPLYYMAAANQ
jgi:hypothetical protein